MVKKIIPVGPSVYSRPYMEDFDTNTPDIDGESAGILDVVNYQDYSVFFRGIRAGNGIAVNLMPIDSNAPDLGNVIVLSATGELVGYINSVTNLGSGTTLTSSTPISDNSLNIRTIQAGNGIDIEVNDDLITISQIPTDEESPATWLVGSGVPSTSTGNVGDMYLNTSNGDVYSKLTSGWNLACNITGEQGSAGTTWYAGSSDPGSTLGNNGDFYYQINKNKIWYKGNGVWSVLSLIVGSQWLNGKGSPLSSSNTSVVANASEGDYYLDTLSGDVYSLGSLTWEKVANIMGPQGTAATINESISSSTSGSSTIGQIQSNVRVLDVIVDVTSSFDTSAILTVGTATDPTLLLDSSNNTIDLTTVGLYEVTVNYANTTTSGLDIVYNLTNPNNTGSATITLSYL